MSNEPWRGAAESSGASAELAPTDRLLLGIVRRDREVLVLREIDEMDYREIAAVANVPIGTMMSRPARARAALEARWLQEAEGNPHAVR